MTERVSSCRLMGESELCGTFLGSVMQRVKIELLSVASLLSETAVDFLSVFVIEKCN